MSVGWKECITHVHRYQYADVLLKREFCLPAYTGHLKTINKTKFTEVLLRQNTNMFERVNQGQGSQQEAAAK